MRLPFSGMPFRSLPVSAVSLSGLLLLLGMLLGCYPRGNPDKPVPTVLVPAAQPAQRLVIVLPGRGDGLAGLQRAGIAHAIQAQWPDADVMLAGLTIDYYLQGGATRRLRDEIVEPARARGYREIWLLGASIGGLGALMYDTQWPRTVDGIVLMAPYLGEDPLLKEIASAGGIERWNPGPEPDHVDGNNFQRELWRHLQGWSRQPDHARHVWLAYGDRDRLRTSMPSLASLLLPSHVAIRSGGHTWSVWTPATRDILAQINASRLQREP